MDIDGSDKSHKSLKRCQFALWKFQRGMWVLFGASEHRMAIWTIEWSVSINSLWTVALHTEAISAETIDKSKTLHSSTKGVMGRNRVFRTTKSWVSRTESKRRPLWLALRLPHTPWWALKSPHKTTFLNLEKNKIFRLYVVRGWIIDVEDRITAHGDPEDFHTSARPRQSNFWELEGWFDANQ